MKIKKNVVEIVCRVDLTGNPFDVLRELDFLLKFLQILGRGFSLHSCAPLNKTSDLCLAGAACGRRSCPLRTAFTRIETQSRPIGEEGKEKVFSRWPRTAGGRERQAERYSQREK